MFTESVRIVVVGCSFSACCSGSTLHDSVFGLWLRPPGNCPVVDLYSLSVTLPPLSYTITILS